MIVIDLNDYPEGLSCQTIARRLLKAGHHQSTQVAFVRAKTPIFNEFLSLAYFANTKVIESHNGEHMKRVSDPYISTQEKPNGTRTKQNAA